MPSNSYIKLRVAVKTRARENITYSSEPGRKQSGGRTWEVFGRDGFLVGFGCRRTLFLLCDSQAFSDSFETLIRPACGRAFRGCINTNKSTGKDRFAATPRLTGNSEVVG